MTKQQAKPAEETSLAPVETQRYDAEWWSPKSFEQAMAMAETMAKSNVIPNNFRGKPGDIMVAWSLGAPMGMSLLSCLRFITVINGMPQIWGDAVLAIARAHPLCEYVIEELEGQDDGMVAVCTIKRRGDPKPIIRKFSVTDAKQAGLWGGRGGKSSVWTTYPKRMLAMRARGFAVRDAFPDALCGMPMVEELRDVTSEVEVRDTEPEGATSTERLKNKLRGRASKAETDPDLPPGQTGQGEPSGETPEASEASTEQPEASEGNTEDGKKTIEDYIAEAQTSADLTRLTEEIGNRLKAKQINKPRQMGLLQMVHDRSQAIATGGKKKGKP